MDPYFFRRNFEFQFENALHDVDEQLILSMLKVPLQSQNEISRECPKQSTFVTSCQPGVENHFYNVACNQDWDFDTLVAKLELDRKRSNVDNVTGQSASLLSKPVEKNLAIRLQQKPRPKPNKTKVTQVVSQDKKVFIPVTNLTNPATTKPPSKKRKRPRRRPYPSDFKFTRLFTLSEFRDMIRAEKEKKKRALVFDNVNLQERKAIVGKVWKSFYFWYADLCIERYDDFLYPRTLLKRAFDQKLQLDFTHEDVDNFSNILLTELKSDVVMTKTRLRTIRNLVTEARIIYHSYLDFAQCTTYEEFKKYREKWNNQLFDPTLTDLLQTNRFELHQELTKFRFRA